MGTKMNHDIDANVDIEISNCLNLESPKSFFLFAGAGSGKTRSLVNALNLVKKQHGDDLSLRGQKVGVISYTNAACDEIRHRVDRDPLFRISTIHSFAWELIKPFTSDIKNHIAIDLKASIEDLEDKQSRVKNISKTSIDRGRKIESKKKRLTHLNQIVQFTYNPNGDNKTKDSVNHSEVINLVSDLLKEKPLLQTILVRKYPILLIDESQDTNKDLIDSLFAVEAENSTHFSLGLIGDMMQRIYLDGKGDLGSIGLPKKWKTPKKVLNHRCPSRIVELINKIREQGDGHVQMARTDASVGIVRLFVVQTPCDSKMKIEAAVAKNMAEQARDKLWTGENRDVQVLTLEHHMAAKRMGFSELFEPLYGVSSLKTGLLDGSDSGLRFFYKIVLPVYESIISGDKFLTARLIKEHSSLLSPSKLLAKENQLDQLKTAQSATDSLSKLWDQESDPSMLEVLVNISDSGLFPIPESLSIIAKRTNADIEIISETEGESEDEPDDVINAWDETLKSPFSQVAQLSKYITGEGKFDTHQGVKGREFPRVMVVLDDEDARGFLFSYDKLFGVKAPSDRDNLNKTEGKETGFDRTLRLFYVTCSRAKGSLAIVAYSSNPALLVSNVVSNDWFKTEEIEQW